MINSQTPTVFLDLEETVIGSWDNPRLINIQAVKFFLKPNGIKDI
jgi:hypothetical protein